MNILIYTTVFFPRVGGIEIHTYNLIEKFTESGHKVRVISSQKSTSSKNPYRSIHPLNILSVIKSFFWSDVYYMPNISLKGIWIMLFNPFKPWVISYNDFSLSEKKILSPIKKFFTLLTTENISVSESVSATLPNKSTVIYNGYDDKIFNSNQLTTNRIYEFAFLGRLVSQKGCDELIYAMSTLSNIKFHLNIIGTGPEEKHLRDTAKRYQIGTKCDFLGVLNPKYVSLILNQTKTLVVPSSGEEGFGLVVLEALACGCRIIAADAGGLKEAVNNFGKLYPMNDFTKLRSLLIADLKYGDEDAELNHELLADYLSKRTISCVSKEYLSIFVTAIERRRKSLLLVFILNKLKKALKLKKNKKIKNIPIHENNIAFVQSMKE